MNGLKDAVLKMIEISKLIVDNNLDGSLLRKTSIDNRRYHSVIIPQIENFKEKYDRKSPEKVLEELLATYLERMNVASYYETRRNRYFGRVLRSYCWAAIILKDPNVKQLTVTHFPQLYILVNRHGIRFGFSYGYNVKPESKFVERVKSDRKIGNQIITLLSKLVNTHLYSEIGGEKEPTSDNILQISGIDDLRNKWSNKVSIVKSYSEPNIPENLENEITNTFDSIFPVYDSLSRGVPLEGKFPVQQPKELKVFDLLSQKKQIILYGPPGTGKTFEAQRFAVDFLSSRSKQEINMRIHARQSSEGKITKETKGRI